MGFLRPISISLSPNTEKDDILLAFKLLFQPWRWKKELAEDYPPLIQLEEEFKKYLGVKYAFSFNSGRSALMAILDSLGLEKESEVLLQAFTCNAVVNPIIWAGLTPVFVDCNEDTFNIDLDDLKRKIGPNSKVVIVQHTFGLPSEIDEVLEICQKNNLILIEDCAHALGAVYSAEGDISTESRYRGQKIGTFGLASFFSFSRDKVISSVYGGMAVTNDLPLAGKLRQTQDKLGYPSYYWIFQQLLHPILTNWLVLPTYSILGKYLLVLFQWLHILSKAVHWKEKRGLRPGYFPKRFPNALAILAQNQFEKIEKFNAHRKEIAGFYRKELKNTLFRNINTSPLCGEDTSAKRTRPQGYLAALRRGSSFELPPEKEQIYLRFAVKHAKARQIIKKAWRKNILIGDWYTAPIAPPDTKLEKMKYLPNSCPKAEKLAKTTLNLPTCINISQKEAQRIVDFLKIFFS